MNADSSWSTVVLLPASVLPELRRRAIFECCKWDPQVGDVNTLAPFALVLKPRAWTELASLAEALESETSALEAALLTRPDLHGRLALPGPVRSVLRPAGQHLAAGGPRLVRYDFHPTPDGWRISEANTDVPGGLNEATGLAKLVGEKLAGVTLLPSPVQQIVDAIAERVPASAAIAMLHATAYSDDRQVMVLLARHLQDRGIHAVLASPDHIRWSQGKAFVESHWFQGEIDMIFRFFPAEWLPNLPRRCAWRHYFAGAFTPLCNPATALLTQSKRTPLVWDALDVPVPTWRRLLPETRDPRNADWQGQSHWVLKPALGRVGDMVGIRGITPANDWKQIRRSVFWYPRHWVAQRRFDSVAVTVNGESWHICLGIYTLNGRAAGVYGRAAPEALINHQARDVAVLLESTASDPNHPAPCFSYDSISAV